jgi:hypothetical protein
MYNNAGIVHSKVVRLDPGLNPTTSTYNASVVKIYNATNTYLSAFLDSKLCFSDIKTL